MNRCFFMGYVISEIKFEFILNGTQDSICQFSIQLPNDCVVEVIAYDDVADYCYRKLIPQKIVFLTGIVTSNLKVIAQKVQEVKGNAIHQEKFLGSL